MDWTRRHWLKGLPALAAPSGAAWPAEPKTERWPRGRATPALELPRWEGPLWRLADARGRVVVLNFWASWCEPCLAELPSLERLAQRPEREGLQVVTVNFRESDSALRRHLARQPLSLPILRDREGDAARAWHVRIFPTTVVIGRDGHARLTVTGEADWSSPAASQWLLPVL